MTKHTNHLQQAPPTHILNGINNNKLYMITFITYYIKYLSIITSITSITMLQTSTVYIVLYCKYETHSHISTMQTTLQTTHTTRNPKHQNIRKTNGTLHSENNLTSLWFLPKHPTLSLSKCHKYTNLSRRHISLTTNL